MPRVRNVAVAKPVVEMFAADYAPKVGVPTSVEGGQLTEPMIEAYQQLSQELSLLPRMGARRWVSLRVDGADISVSQLIIGVAIGAGTDVAQSKGPPGDPVLRLYVDKELSRERVAEFVAIAYDLRTLGSGAVPFEVVHTGPIDLLAHRMRMRPAPGGISCGHINITAGTLGCLARGRKAPRDGLTLIVSNNHVLANVNTANQGDPVLQPGPADGGMQPADVIAKLERYVTIDFTRSNFVDGATAAVTNPQDVRREQLFIKNAQPNFLTCGTTPAPVKNGLIVGKSGRTTQMTSGRITGVGAKIHVDMGGGRIAVFEDQIEIQGITGNFSQPGDSGSLVWTWDSQRLPVGLLFAGGGGLTFANPIHHVLNALDIDLL